MIDKILKMGGCSNLKEFYSKYPSEGAFLEAFPQARPMLEQFKKGGIKKFAAGGLSMDEPCPPGYIYDPIYGCIEVYQKDEMQYSPEQINRFWEKKEKSGIPYDFYDNAPAIPEDDPFMMQIKENYKQIHENQMRNPGYKDYYEKHKDYIENKEWPQEQKEIYIDEKLKLFKKYNVPPNMWMDMLVNPKTVFPSGPSGPNQKYNIIPGQEYQMMQDEYEREQNERCPCTKDKPMSDGTIKKVCVPCGQTAMAPAPTNMAPAQMRLGGMPKVQFGGARKLDSSEYQSAAGEMLPPSYVSSVSDIRTVSGQDSNRGKYFDQNTEKWSNVNENMGDQTGNTYRMYTRGSTDPDKAPFMEYFSQNLGDGSSKNQLRFITDDGTTVWNQADPFMRNFLDKRIDFKSGAMQRKKGGPKLPKHQVAPGEHWTDKALFYIRPSIEKASDVLGLGSAFIAESAAALTGQPYNFGNIGTRSDADYLTYAALERAGLPTTHLESKQRNLGDVMYPNGPQNKDEFINYLAAMFAGDPLSYFGVGIMSNSNKAKNIIKTGVASTGMIMNTVKNKNEVTTPKKLPNKK